MLMIGSRAVLVSLFEKSDSDAVIFRMGIVTGVVSSWHLLETKNFHRICGSSLYFRSRLLVGAASETPAPLLQFFVSDHHEANRRTGSDDIP